MIDENAFARTNVMSAEEVIIRIKDKMSQLTPEIRKAFLALDKKGKGRITKRQFREVGYMFLSKNLNAIFCLSVFCPLYTNFFSCNFCVVKNCLFVSRRFTKRNSTWKI